MAALVSEGWTPKQYLPASYNPWVTIANNPASLAPLDSAGELFLALTQTAVVHFHTALPCLSLAFPSASRASSTPANLTLSRKAHLSSKKLLEQCQKMEKLWGHVLTSTLPLHADNWYNKVTDLIEKQQTAPIWMSDTKVRRCAVHL